MRRSALNTILSFLPTPLSLSRLYATWAPQLREHGLDLEFELWEALGDGLLEAIDEVRILVPCLAKDHC